MDDDAQVSGVKQVSAYLRTSNALAAIHYYVEAFGAVEKFRLTEPTDRIAHAELQLGEATIMVSDEYPEKGIMGPSSFDGTTVAIYLQVVDVDGVFAAAVGAGGTSLQEPNDEFYGQRVAKVRDPFGHEWLLSQQLEKLSPVEMQERFDAMFK